MLPLLPGDGGALSARITRELLQSGFTVTSGRDGSDFAKSFSSRLRTLSAPFSPLGTQDLEQAEGLLDFAKRFELLTRAESSKLTLKELDLADEDSIAAAMPK